MVLFAAATGLRPGEWLALEHRDVDREAQVVYVRRTLRNGRIKTPKTKASVRAVPLQAIALAALDELPRPDPERPLLFPSATGGYFDLHNFRNRYWRPAQQAAGITPLRRLYDLRHTFATFAPPCRHLHLRPLPLHGNQPRDDRPSLRPPRPRRTRARDQAARHLP
jgi:integrase